MAGWLHTRVAEGIDRLVATVLVRPAVAAFADRFRTDEPALRELLDRCEGRPAVELFGVAAVPSEPVTIEAPRATKYGELLEMAFPSPRPWGDPDNDRVRVRLVLSPGADRVSTDIVPARPPSPVVLRTPPSRPFGVARVPSGSTALAVGPGAGSLPGRGAVMLLVPGWMTQGTGEYIRSIGRTPLSAGCHVAVIDTPMHHRRTPRGLFSGVGALSADLVRSAAVIAQAVADVGASVAWLRAVGFGAVGVWGESLGGWITALHAESSDLADLAAVNVPAVRLDEQMRRSPLLPAIRSRLKRTGLSEELRDRALRMLSPLSFPAMLPPDRLRVIEASHDVMLPGRGVTALWEHWGRPPREVLPHGHISVRFSSGFHRALRRWSEDLIAKAAAREPRTK